MSQFERPDSDISDDHGWSPTPLWQQIDETPASDADFISLSMAAKDVATLQLGLSNVTDPASSTGHVLRVRARSSIGGLSTLVFNLLQGAASVASSAVTLTSGFFTYSYNLTGAEADAITDYTDLNLQIQIVAGSSNEVMDVSFAEFEVPDVAGGGAFSSDGTGAASWVGIGIGGDFTSSGTGDAQWVGLSLGGTQPGDLSSDGSSTVSWVGASTNASTINQAGTGAANFVGTDGTAAPAAPAAPVASTKEGFFGAAKGRTRKRVQREDEEIIALLEKLGPELMKHYRKVN